MELFDEPVKLHAPKRAAVERVVVLGNTECVDAKAIPKLVGRQSPRPHLIARKQRVSTLDTTSSQPSRFRGVRERLERCCRATLVVVIVVDLSQYSALYVGYLTHT